jgi:hypothetical protein
MEPTTGIEPVNLILTKDVLYLLSYVGQPFIKITVSKLHRVCKGGNAVHIKDAISK